MMYSVQSRNYEFKLLACGFRRIDLQELCRDRNGEILKNLIQQKERISYLFENGLSHVYISTRNELYPESLVPNILKSRAGLKLFEIMQFVELQCKTFVDICAGPGAMSDLLLKSHDCTGIGVSLNQEDKSKHFYSHLHCNDRYHIASGEDGDITRIEVISEIAAMCDAIFGKYNADILIADGAPNLEFHQEDYQEIYAQKIILGEVICALECVKRHGTLVLKIFDSFTKFTRCVVYLLTKIFGTVKIIKPSASRITNSEKYIVGIDLVILDEKRIDLLRHLQVILYNFKDGYNCEEIISLDKDSRFDQTFETAMANLAKKQLESLAAILDQIDYKIFRIESKPSCKGKGDGKGKGKGKGKSKRKVEPYPTDDYKKVAPPPPLQELEYSPFEDECCFPEDD